MPQVIDLDPSSDEAEEGLPPPRRKAASASTSKDGRRDLTRRSSSTPPPPSTSISAGRSRSDGNVDSYSSRALPSVTVDAESFRRDLYGSPGSTPPPPQPRRHPPSTSTSRQTATGLSAAAAAAATASTSTLKDKSLSPLSDTPPFISRSTQRRNADQGHSGTGWKPRGRDVSQQPRRDDGEDDDDDEPFEAPSFTAYTSRPLRRARDSSSSSVSPSKPAATSTSSAGTNKARARPAPRRAKVPMTAEEEERLRMQREQEAQADAFFTSSKQIVFKAKGLPVKRDKSEETKDVKVDVKPQVASRPKNKPVEIVLDDSDSGSSSSGAPSESDSSDGKRKRKRSSKKRGRPEAALKADILSPVKAIIMGESSSSSDSSDSDSSGIFSSSSQERRKKAKKLERRKKKRQQREQQQNKGKGKGKAREIELGDSDSDNEDDDERRSKKRKRSRSLTPVGKVDTFAIAHALQDVRRNMPAYSITRNREEEDDDDVFLRDIFGKKPEEIVPRHRASSHDSLPSARSRSISIQPGGGLGVGAQRDSPSRLTPLVEEKPLTEAENNEKYGHKVKITVVMVLDPRIEVNASNQASVKVYTSGYPVDMRAKENFSGLFKTIATSKGVPQDALVLTYNDHRIYQYGSPHALQILSHAEFKGYHTDTYTHIKRLQHEERQQRLKAEREAHLEILAAEAQRLNGEAGPSNIASEGLRGDATVGGDDDVELVPAAGAGASASTSSSKNSRETVSPAKGKAATGSAAPKEPMMRLSIQGGNRQQKLLLAVPKSKTIATLIKHFLKQSGLPKDLAPRCRMALDGEDLDHSATIEDAGVEDEDSLDIKVPSS